MKGGVVNIYGPYRTSEESSASTDGKIWALKMKMEKWFIRIRIFYLTNHTNIFNESERRLQYIQ